MKHSLSPKTIANCINFLYILDYCPDQSAIKRQMDYIYQKQLTLSRVDKQKQFQYLKEMHVPLRRRDKGINGHDGKYNKCNKCETKVKVISKTQSLMKDQKESISSLKKIAGNKKMKDSVPV